ncbi:hypothetical protein CGC20_31320 [Leishmania donovani]|uniref:Uncharacterized protein n=1 Tax=Leishmania donovani TaxID=5661 RepID=A0A504XKB2_LEIDO|nr:hypothetical protein CGC20_31320 [Leishmania donovani]
MGSSLDPVPSDVALSFRMIRMGANADLPVWDAKGRSDRAGATPARLVQCRMLGLCKRAESYSLQEAMWKLCRSLQSAALNPGYDDKPESAPASKGESPTPSLQAALDAKTDAMKSSAREDDRYLSAQEQSSVLVKMCQQKSARHPAVPLRVPRGLNPTPLKPFAMGELEAALRQVPCESVKAPHDARQESTAEHLQP